MGDPAQRCGIWLVAQLPADDFMMGSFDQTIAIAMYNPSVAQSVEQLSFELTAGALAEQERALAGLRTRAGTVIAAASIAGSFLGAETSHGAVGAWGALALFVFVLCVASAIWVLMAHDLVFAFDGQTLLAVSDPRGHDIPEAYRAASVWIEHHLGENREKIQRLSAWMTASCVLLATEIVLWTLSLTV